MRFHFGQFLLLLDAMLDYVLFDFYFKVILSFLGMDLLSDLIIDLLNCYLRVFINLRLLDRDRSNRLHLVLLGRDEFLRLRR